jgi:hypothetical protein
VHTAHKNLISKASTPAGKTGMPSPASDAKSIAVGTGTTCWQAVHSVTELPDAASAVKADPQMVQKKRFIDMTQWRKSDPLNAQ